MHIYILELTLILSWGFPLKFHIFCSDLTYNCDFYLLNMLPLFDA